MPFDKAISRWTEPKGDGLERPKDLEISGIASVHLTPKNVSNENFTQNYARHLKAKWK